MSGNMPNNYFPYQPRFGDQRYQNQRFPNGQPNTYNRNQPFYPFGKPQDCYQPNFNPNWSGNGSCNPCDKLALANDAERTKLEFQAQDKESKRNFLKNVVVAGAGVLGLAFLLPFMRKIIGAPAISNNNSGGGSGSNNTITSTGGDPTPEQLKQQKKDADATAEALAKQKEKEAEAAKKAADEYNEVK